jgi:hypothetical protein
VAGAVSVPGVTLDANGCRARYGLSYVRSICSQAGVGMTETAPDEDVLAVDCSVEFPEAAVRVQVKCTSQWSISGSQLTYPVEAGWVRKWDAIKVPMYFVVVIVPKDPDDWIRHEVGGTAHQTAAYWVRLIPGEIGTSINVPKKQRLTKSTMTEWHKDLLDLFSPGGSHE